MAALVDAAAARLHAFGDAVRAATPHLGGTYDPNASNTATWFLSPEQHLVEWAIFNCVCAWLLYTQAKRHRWTVLVAADARDPSDSAWVWADRLLAACSISVLCATLVFKYLSNCMIFLLQPCHIQNLALVIFAVSRGRFAGTVFNIYLHCQFGAWLALLGPDTSELLLPGEVFSFFFQHVLLVTAPFYYIARRRFPLYNRRVLYCWALYVLFHLNILFPVSVISGFNMNYTCNPAPGLLEDLGWMYRFVATCAFLLLQVVCRDALAGGFARLVVDSDAQSHAKSADNESKKGR